MPRHFCARCAGFLLLALGSVGLLLQLTVKDRLAGLAVLFYAMPPLVVVGLLLPAAGLLARRSSLRWALLSAIVAMLAIVTWVRTDYVHARPAVPAGSLRVVLWNMAGPRDAEPLARILKETGGQVVLLLESGIRNESRRRCWQTQFPNHSIHYMGGNATLLSEYPLSGISAHVMGKRTRVHTCALHTPSGTISLAMVDIESNLSSDRGPLVARAYEIATSLPSPTIVLGDFNTPHTSVFFREFRRSFRHAFESSGTGLIPTWPALCPALALDHIWLSIDLLPVRAWTVRTLHSDHAIVIADVTLSTVAPRKSSAGPDSD